MKQNKVPLVCDAGVFMSTLQAGSWSVSGPWKLWAWPRPWCSSPTWPCPATVSLWPPCLASRASARCISPTRLPASWRISSRRRCTPSTTPATPWSPTSCSAASTGCARSSCCGSSGGPNLCQVTQPCSSGSPSVGRPWGEDLEGCMMIWKIDWRQVPLNKCLGSFFN